jgi:hypothetical protein
MTLSKANDIAGRPGLHTTEVLQEAFARLEQALKRAHAGDHGDRTRRRMAAIAEVIDARRTRFSAWHGGDAAAAGDAFTPSGKFRTCEATN